MAKSPRIQALEAAMAHMPAHIARNLAIGIKMMEIKSIDKNSFNENIAPDWRLKAIVAMIPHLSEDKQKSLGMITQFMEMKEIFANMEIIKEMTN